MAASENVMPQAVGVALHCRGAEQSVHLTASEWVGQHTFERRLDYTGGRHKAVGEPIVYVVDDDSDVREGLKQLVESVGWKCRSFSATAEFMRAKLSDQASCLILDVRFPDGSGLELQAEMATKKIQLPII